MDKSELENQIEDELNTNGDLFQSGYQFRAWLRSHGKEEYITFSDQSLLKLRKYFNSLDEQGNGSLGVAELEDAFIAFGLSNNREEVQKLITSVDSDGSGKIQFDQFLEIMTSVSKKGSSTKSNAMYDFFSKMSSGQLGDDYDNDLSFRMNVSQFRRKKILQSVMGESQEKKEKGMKILKNFKKQILNNPVLKHALNESKKDSILTKGFTVKSGKKSN